MLDRLRARFRAPAPAALPLGSTEPPADPVASFDAWARAEAERLLADDVIAGDFMIGEPVDAPAPVLAAMDQIIRERERRDV